MNSDHVYVDFSTVHGFGVFAKKDFAPEEIIETCPVILLDKKHNAEAVSDYYFRWDETAYAMPCGYGMLYNHAQDPSAYWKCEIDDHQLVILAKRKIRAGEEIFVYYGDTWFEDRGIELKENPPPEPPPAPSLAPVWGLTPAEHIPYLVTIMLAAVVVFTWFFFVDKFIFGGLS